jgi:hypothetical protein
LICEAISAKFDDRLEARSHHSHGVVPCPATRNLESLAQDCTHNDNEKEDTVDKIE